MLLILILPLCIVYSQQNSDVNCLRKKPGAIEASINFFRNSDGDINTTAENIVETVNLLSTRFKSLHALTLYSPRLLRTTMEGISLYKNKSKKSFPIFLSVFPNMTYDIKTETQRLIETASAIKKINSEQESPVIVGLYVSFVTRNLDLQVELLEAVFGPKESSLLPIGYMARGCLGNLQRQVLFKFLSRMNFVACIVDAVPKRSPEESADDVIRKCDEIRDTAPLYKLKFEVKCLTAYASQGKENTLGSVDYFQRFWCRIAHKLAHNQSHAQVIFFSVFDDNSETLKAEKNVKGEPDRPDHHHLGWWRSSSSQVGGWLEKVEELPGGSEYGKCTGECHLCTSSAECCAEMICIPFHPSQQGQPPLICRSRTSNCTRIYSSSDSIHSYGPITIAAFSLVGIVGGIAVATFIGYFFSLRNRSSTFLSTQEITHFYEGSLFFSPTGNIEGNLTVQGLIDNLPYDKEKEVVRTDFEIYEDQLLSSGAFGVVTKGRLGNHLVAVKTTLPGVETVYLKALMLELKVLMYLGHHENIVNLLGAHTTQLNSGKLFLFIELCSFGNLLQFVRSHRHHFTEATVVMETSGEETERKLMCTDLLQWCIQIASAMKHLAGKRVIHGDIAARNVLVFSKDQVKLTDFGLSRRLYQHSNYVKNSQEPLLWRHMSIEALKDLSFSVHSDVWAFGIMMWEIFSLGEVPFPEQNWSNDFVKLLSEGLHPLQPQHAHPQLYEVMVSCWTKDIKLRPSIALVYSRLTSALDEQYSEVYSA